jgi:hypothetical protein
VQHAALREQMRDGVGPFSPYWRDRFKALKLKATSISSVDALRKLPAVGERDVCPGGDPRDAATLVLQADETGFALHVPGAELRKALLRRLRGSAAYRRQVEAALRPTTYHFAGRTVRFPVGSTRGDLDLIARAGARAFAVAGLTGDDVLVSAVPVGQTLEHVFLSYAALGSGVPALFPGAAAEDVGAALDLVPATVLAVPGPDAARLINELGAAGVGFDSLRVVLLVGPFTASDRTEATAALRLNGAGNATVLGLYGPPEGRVLWAECAPERGYHTYPDLDIVELVDPDTAAPATSGGEVVVTQLGFRGTALVRWRTGDTVEEPIATGACPSCNRTVPRVSSRVRHGALLTRTATPGRESSYVDLRAVGAALSGRQELSDWYAEVRRSPRTGADQLVLYIATDGDEAIAAGGAYRDVRAGAGVRPTQVVVEDESLVAARRQRAGGRLRTR